MTILALTLFASCAQQGKQEQVAVVNIQALNPFASYKVDSAKKLVIITRAPRNNHDDSLELRPINFGRRAAQDMLTRLQQPSFSLKKVVTMYHSYYIVFLDEHDDILCAASCMGDYFHQISFIKSDGFYFPEHLIPFNGSNRNWGESDGLQKFVERLAKIDLDY